MSKYVSRTQGGIQLEGWVLLTLFVPPLGMLLGLLGLWTNKMHWKYCILCIALCLSSFAYAYMPTVDHDLLRYITFIESFEDVRLVDAFKMSMGHEANLGVFNLFCWIIYHTGDAHLAPAITVFINYYISMYITCVCADDIKCDSKLRFLYILFALITPQFVSITNNIRNITAFSLVGLALFRDCYQKRRNIVTLLLYVVPLMIHTTALIVIAMRIVIDLPREVRIPMLIAVFFAHPFVNYLYGWTSSLSSGMILIDVLKNVVKSGYKYFNDTSSAWGLMVQSSVKQQMARAAFMSLSAYLAGLLLFNRRQTSIKQSSAHFQNDNAVHGEQPLAAWNALRMENLGFFFILFTFSCWKMLTPGYWRFVTMAVMFGGGMYFSICSNQDDGLWYYANRGLIVFIPIFVVLSLRNLMGCDQILFITKPFVSTPFWVMGKVLIHLIMG